MLTAKRVTLRSDVTTSAVRYIRPSSQYAIVPTAPTWVFH